MLFPRRVLSLPALLLAAGLTLVLAAAPAPAQAEPAADLRLESIVPTDVFAFASFAGIDACSQAAQQLGLYALWQEQEVQDFVKELMADYEAAVAEAPPEALARWKQAKQLLSGRLSVAVAGLTYIWGRDGRDVFPVPFPGLVVALDTRGHRAEIEGVLESFLGGEEAKRGMQREQIERSDETYKGHEIIVLSFKGRRSPQLSLAATFIDNLFVCTLNRTLLKKCIDNHQAGSEQTLTNLPSLRRARSKVQGKPLFEIFVNYAEVTRRVKGLVPDEWLEALRELGLDSLNGEYWASTVRDGASFDTLYVDMPGERRGLAAIPTPPIGDDVLKLVPKGAALAMAARSDLAPVWDGIWNLVLKLGPARELAFMKRGLERTERRIGFKIRDDLIAALGDAWLGYVEKPGNGMIPNVVLSVDVRDRAKVEQVLAAILERARGVSVRDVAFGEHTLKVVSLGRRSVVSPSYALVGDRLWVSLFPTGLKQAIRHQSRGGESLLDNAEFQSTFAKLDRTRAELVWFFDARLAAAFGYDWVENFGPGLVPEDELPVDLAMLPGAEVVLKHLKGWGGVGHTDQDGFVYHERSLSVASVLAILSRMIDKAPGPLHVVLQQMGRSASRHVGLEDVTHGMADPVAPSRAINPLRKGDPEEQEVRKQLAAFESAIKLKPESAVLRLQRGTALHRLRRYSEAAPDFVFAHQHQVGIPTSTYNAACCFSLAGNKDEAIKWLATAFKHGFDNWMLIDSDTDLDNVRSDPRFQKLVAKHRGL